VDVQAPARWSRLCKDYNPIHIHAVAAKLFGFPGKIAHGNLVVGMVLEQFLSESLEALGDSSYLDVAFRRPMAVPLNVMVKIAVQDSLSPSLQATSINQRGEEKVHIEGRFGVIRRREGY